MIENSVTKFLSAPVATSGSGLCHRWGDQTASVILQFDRPVDPLKLADIIRRWFLFRLSDSASPEARKNRPCPWEPPCTFDLFKREQLRLRSDGLPKPYTLAVMTRETLAEVRLRVFGRALERFSAASDTLVKVLSPASSWQGELGCAPPLILNRFHDQIRGLPIRDVGTHLQLICHSPIDISGGKPGSGVGRSMLGRGLRRVDAMARWQGLSYDPGEMTQIKMLLDQLVYDETALLRSTYENTAKKKQPKRFEVVTGHLSLSGDLTPLAPMLHLLERCNLGRGAVQGLGVIELLI